MTVKARSQVGHFIKLVDNMVDVVEYFSSIQGEGKFQGKNAFFIRFAGCNLKCVGFGCSLRSPKTGEMLLGCDTIRAAQSSHFEYEKFDSQRLISLLLGLKHKPLIIITGGEPLIYYSDRDLLKFLEYAISVGFSVQFETNGTIDVDFAKFPIYKKCTFAVSVKLALSGEPAHKRINKKVLKSLFSNASCFYKFVTTGEQIDEIKEILALQNGEVWCMPLARDQNELEYNAKNVVNLCIENGFNYSDRLHIRIWNDLDGV